jgi:hypothetical protein
MGESSPNYLVCVLMKVFGDTCSIFPEFFYSSRIYFRENKRPKFFF